MFSISQKKKKSCIIEAKKFFMFHINLISIYIIVLCVSFQLFIYLFFNTNTISNNFILFFNVYSKLFMIYKCLFTISIFDVGSYVHEFIIKEIYRR